MFSSEPQPNSLVEIVRRHARERGERTAYRFLGDGELETATLTFSELAYRACGIGKRLRERGLCGKPVLVLCPAGIDYVVSLVGCWFGGAIAVPSYPPTGSSLPRVLPRTEAIALDAGIAAALVTADVKRVLESSGSALLGSLPMLSVEPADARCTPDELDRNAAVNDADAAILQYTSGSTSSPKGVVVSHANILANVEMGRAAGRLSADDVFALWLPPYHDMGLIGGIIQPLFLGAQAVLMPPDAFIRRPRRWLSMAQQHRASVLVAPNFAFDLCVRRIHPREREGLDLSSWRVVFNGSEPIDAGCLERFAEAFARFGFRREAFYPCYGMAETTLIISGGEASEPPVVRGYLPDELEANRAVRADTDAGFIARDGLQASGPRKVRRLVGCGKALLDERILIVAPDTRRICDERCIGEIWVKSRSVAAGYWNRAEESERVFGAYTADTAQGPFLRTGDLGFFDAGELFVTGRLKDLIIVRGLNHYPQDLERTTQQLDAALVVDSGAAFSVATEYGEELVLVQEYDKRVRADPNELLRRIPDAITRSHDLSPAAIVLIKRGSLAKTSSGKVQRAATKRAYLAGELQVVARWQAPSTRSEASMPAADAAAGHSHVRRITWRREQQRIVDWLRTHLGERLKLPPQQIDAHEPLARLGVDSLIAAELTEELSRWLGVELPSTISYDNPTIADLAYALAALPAARQGRGSAVLSPRALAPAPAEAFAVIGMGCRFPGAPDLDGFWRLLRNGGDAVTEIPSERWDREALYDPRPGTPGKTCSKWGGFIRDIDRFDAEFFGISAKEAERIDPQQRIFLETAWEALEDAAQSPAALARTATGVFVGVCTSDYATLYGGELRLIDAHYGTGNAPSIVANRLSYLLDLKGPSEIIDSACSSALVALQHACRSLRDRETDLAIVGGVNAILAPAAHVYFSQAGALSRDGRCKTFDSAADGFVRGEGAGVVVLKRLSDAVADGDRIYAMIAGTAVNHDGRSNGLLAPNGLSQQALVRQALVAAGIAAADLQYVEAHGVGTPVSDAVELHALGAVMAGRDPHDPLLVGSAKTNVGHLEAASGMVGLIKVCLALHHEQIPPHLHLKQVHADIGIERLPLAIPTSPTPWRRGPRKRYAGVSAFGFGGTNAHAVVGEAPEPLALAEAMLPEHLLALSAKSAPALRALAMRFGNRLAKLSDADLRDVCSTANAGRTHFERRLALVGDSAQQLSHQLLAFARGGHAANSIATGARPGEALRLAFVFPETPVSVLACAELHAAHPQFMRVLQRCDELLRPRLKRSLLEVLYGAGAQSPALLLRPCFAHAALTSLQWAMHSLWKGWGIEPTAIYGAGAGEFAAAAASGVLAWEQAVVLAAGRGLLRESLTPNAERTITVRQFKAELAGVSWQTPHLPFVSASIERAFQPGEVPDAAHWGRHIYHTCKPDEASAALLEEECQLYLGFGMANAPAASAGAPADLWLPTCSGRGTWRATLEGLSRLYGRGALVDWSAFHAPFAYRKLSLPNYPFERRRHWLDFTDRPSRAREPAVLERASSHPLISRIRIHAPAHAGFARNEETGDDGQ